MFYWTRGNESVSGLDTLQLAQYTVEDHYTSVSEAVYETGKNELQNHRPNVTSRAILMFKQQCSIVKYCIIRALMGRISDSHHMFAVIKYTDILLSPFSKVITPSWSSTLS